MSDWFTMNLGDAMLAADPLERIKERFQFWHESSNCPEDAAVFLRHESEGQLHCDVRIFFSPASAVVASEFGATPCGKPARGGLGLLAGAPGAWPALFPEPGGDQQGRDD